MHESLGTRLDQRSNDRNIHLTNSLCAYGSIYLFRAVGSSVGVERPSVAMPEAAQRPIVFPCEFFSIIQLSSQEIALVASRYIECRALTSCSSTPSLSIQAEIKHTAIFLEFERYSDTNTRVQSSKATRKKNWHEKWGGPGRPSRPASNGPVITNIY